MTRNEALAGIVEELADITGADPASITEDKLFEDLGIDSLQKIELIRATERRFGVEIPDQRSASWDTLKTVGQLVDQVVMAGRR
jgi:acyl carrier protein